VTREPGSERLAPFGDGALLVELGEAVDVRLARRARRLARAIEILRTQDPRLGAPVAGAASVLVPFDPLELRADEVATMLGPLVRAIPLDPGPDPGAREVSIPVRYGGEDGPDLAAVAAEAGLSPAEVVRLHAGSVYEVLFLGFAPGFAYLGEVPAQIALPRLATPRTRVPAGSVGIAGRQTGVYPRDSAGGWRIVGRTDTPLFDPWADEPARLRPGDRVRFEPL
jgi:KipI family sensor histidine kinase inhibitor